VMKPYDSTIMPKAGHPMRTRKKPNPKESEPCTVYEAHLLARNINGTETAWVLQGECQDLVILRLGEELHSWLQPNGQ